MGVRRVREVPPEDVLRCPSGDTFVRAGRAKGILPEILEELLAARKRAKADLKAADDPFVKAVLDGRQLALKVPPGSALAAAVLRCACLRQDTTVHLPTARQMRPCKTRLRKRAKAGLKAAAETRLSRPCSTAASSRSRCLMWRAPRRHLCTYYARHAELSRA